MRTVELDINDSLYTVEVEDNELLVDTIRDRLRLYGTKLGCGSGECGACTVVMDGEIVNSCLILSCRAEKRKIQTIEGLEKNGKQHPLQAIFEKNAALQCGYCGPGMILSAKTLVDQNPEPTEQEIRAWLSGNLCRCTGYVNIVRSVTEYALSLKNGQQGENT